LCAPYVLFAQEQEQRQEREEVEHPAAHAQIVPRGGGAIARRTGRQADLLNSVELLAEAAVREAVDVKT
jgi:hypothetical protein